MIKYTKKKLIFFFLLILFCNIFSESEKKILVLHSYHQGYAWTDRQAEGIEDVFSDKTKFELYHEYLDYKRYNSEVYTEKLIQACKEKKRDIKFDGIITTDDFALNFVLKHRATVFKNIPLVFSGVNDPEPSIYEIKNATGVVERPDHRGTFDMMLSLHPKTKNIIIITDKTVTGQEIKEEIVTVLPEYFGKVKFEIHEDYNFDELLEGLKELPKDTLVYIVAINKTMDEKFISNKSVLNLINSSNAPFYSSWELYLNGGILGGKILEGRALGQKAAEMMERIISGVSPDKIYVEDNPMGYYIFDAKVLKRFNISSKDLPVNSKVINSEESLYERYKGLIAVVVIIFAFVIVVMLLKLYFEKKEERLINERNKVLEEEVNLRTIELEKANFELKKQQEKRIRKAYKDGFVKVKIEILKEIMEVLEPLEMILSEEIDYKEIDLEKELEILDIKIFNNLQESSREVQLRENADEIPKIVENMRYRKQEELKRLKYCEKEINHLKEIVRVGKADSGKLLNESYISINDVIENIVEKYKDGFEIKLNFEVIEKLLLNEEKITKIISDLIKNQMETALSKSLKSINVETLDEEKYISVNIFSREKIFTEEFLKNIFNLEYITNSKDKNHFKLYGCYQTIKKIGGILEVRRNTEFGDLFTLKLPK